LNLKGKTADTITFFVDGIAARFWRGFAMKARIFRDTNLLIY
jgi:hypothetical protein